MSPRLFVAGAGLPVSAEAPLVSCEREAAFLRAQLEVYEGRPQAWPVELSPHFQPEDLERALVESWVGVGEITDMACDEYPCIVTVELINGESSCCSQLQEGLPEELLFSTLHSHGYKPDVDSNMFAVLAMGDRTRTTEDLSVRIDWRIERALELLEQELAGDEE
jgi:hypothetical protein